MDCECLGLDKGNDHLIANDEVVIESGPDAGKSGRIRKYSSNQIIVTSSDGKGTITYPHWVRLISHSPQVLTQA